MEMNEEKDSKEDIIDKDLYEEFDDEELYELVQEAKEEALQRARQRQEEEKKKTSRFPKWIYWLIAFAMVMYVFQMLPQSVSIPAVEFLKKSATLSLQDDIKQYKEAVVVIETNDSRGTGFSFTERGDILTNYHVIEGYKSVTVAFQDGSLFVGDVVETYPEIDLAVLKTDAEETPFLPLASSFIYEADEPIYFIGNPMRFTRIANEGTVIDYTYVKSKHEPVVMLDAPVYRGNSGSPVIDRNGEVIGVIFATTHHDEEGRVGLFIPIDYYYAKKEE